MASYNSITIFDSMAIWFVLNWNYNSFMKALSPIPDCMEIGLSLCIASYVFSYLQVLKTLSDPNHFHFKIFGFEEFISTKKTM